MKAYTDLEQSKTLAEFLPPKSADMMWEQYLTDKPYVTVKPWTTRGKPIGSHCRCCWSLAALLDVLPKNLNIGRPSLESNYERYYWIQYYDEFMKPNNYKTKCYDNPINACYEMILKLHELKLL